jgi:TonB family protein
MKKLVLSLFALASLVPAVALAQQQPVRVGGNVKAPERIRYVVPAYPEEAKAAGVSGIVIAEAVVGPDGSVTDAHVIRSIALLDQAALDAIKQWKYTPTTLNGVPVPVIMTVTVNFSGGSGANPPGSSSMSDNSFGPGHPLMEGQSAPPEPVYLNGREVMRIGGDVKAPERIHYVQPAYPADAQAARITGIVIIEALIDESGHVAKAKVVRSVLGLDQAAIDAVMQWEYTPTLLNGNPVPVMMTVTVNFTLQ